MARFALLAAFVILQLLRDGASEEPQPEFPRFERIQTRVALSPNRGYRDVVVAIGEYVAEDPNLIERIKSVFTDLSAFLYSATDEYGSGVYFEEVRILIPDTWSDDPLYETRIWESFAASDIRVDLPPNSLPNEHQPATSKPTHCGAPGLYIHLTPDYITDDTAARPYGNRNRTLTHEWAHYRWGVFDEYPTEGYPHFYAGESGQPEATKCVSAIKGSMRRSDGQPCTLDAYMFPEEACRFFDDNRQTGTYEGSLMYKQFLPKMRTFCDSSNHTSNPAITHNAMAPNEQNNLCNSRSIWEILREHSDFIGAVPSGQPPNLAPSFRLVKRKEARSPVVIVLDRSGSMKGQKLNIVRQASYNLVTRVLNDGQVFGAVAFESTAATVIAPQEITSGNRDQLTSHLPNVANGGTSLAAGLREGIAALQRYGQDYRGTEMIALTDGNTDKQESGVTNLQLAGITVHTVAIGPQAEPNLEQLAMRTGGRTFEQSDQSAALFNIFTKLAVQDDSGSVNILSEPFNLTVNTTRSFSVDSLSAGVITILVGFPADTLGSYEVRVVKQNGDVIDATNVRSPDRFRLVPAFDLVQIDTESIAGDWEIRVTPSPSATVTHLLGTMHVETKRRLQTGSDGTIVRPTIPIQADVLWALASMEPSQIQTVTVTVHRGYTPISAAEVTVIVVNDGSRDVQLTAYDDGIGADVKPNDGVYSAFFTQFSGAGRYSLQVTVRGKNGVTKLLDGARVGKGLAAYDPNLLPEFRPRAVDTGSFERSIEGDSFRCSGDGCLGTKDVYTPYRIRDLRAIRGVNLTAILTFTATGDDLDYGTANYYEIRISDDSDQILSQLQEAQILEFVPEEMRGNGTSPPYVILGDPSSPKESRKKEVFHVELPREGDFSYIFSVVAVDNEDQRSRPSNLASVTAMPAAAMATPKPVAVTQEVPVVGSILPAIVGAILGFLLLVALVVVALSLLKRRKQDKDEVDEETEFGTVKRDQFRTETLPDVRGSPGRDEVSKAYQLSKATRNDAEKVMQAGMVNTSNTRGIDNPALVWDENVRSAPYARDDHRRHGGESDSDDDDADDYVNAPSPDSAVGQSPGNTEMGLSTSSRPPAIPMRAHLSPEQALIPLKPSLTPRQVRDQPKPVPRSRAAGNTDEIGSDGSTPHAEGIRDQSIYPFVSVGSGLADETNTAYQFTRVAELEFDEPVKAEKVYVAPPQQPATTAAREDDSSSDEDDGDYEPVANPNNPGNQIMGMMQTRPEAHKPVIPVKKNEDGRVAKRALQPPTPVSREMGQNLEEADSPGGNDFLGELTNALSRPTVAQRGLGRAGGDSVGYSEEPSSLAFDDHVYDDAPRSEMPFGMADDDGYDSDKDDYEFVNDPDNAMALGLDRPL